MAVAVRSTTSFLLRERGRAWWALVGCLALALVLRAPYLSSGLGLDEGGVAFIAKNWPSGDGSLYGSYWLDRPPLLVALYRVAVLGGDTGVRVLGALAALALADSVPGGTAVLMLLSRASDEAVFGPLRAGATGLLLRDAAADALVDGVRVVASGEALLAPRHAQCLVEAFLARPERLRSIPEQLDELTARERDVVALVGCGLSNDEIAERLVVARATAKTHVSSAMCKLGARDRAQLVVLACESGLVGRRPPELHVPEWPAWSGFSQHRLAA